MRNQKEKTELDELNILSIPQIMLEAAGIPSDSDLCIEAIPGVLLIAQIEPLRQANQPLLDLFAAIGIKPEEVEAALMEGGYQNE